MSVVTSLPANVSFVLPDRPAAATIIQFVPLSVVGSTPLVDVTAIQEEPLSVTTSLFVYALPLSHAPRNVMPAAPAAPVAPGAPLTPFAPGVPVAPGNP